MRHGASQSACIEPSQSKSSLQAKNRTSALSVSAYFRALIAHPQLSIRRSESYSCFLLAVGCWRVAVVVRPKSESGCCSAVEFG